LEITGTRNTFSQETPLKLKYRLFAFLFSSIYASGQGLDRQLKSLDSTVKKWDIQKSKFQKNLYFVRGTWEPHWWESLWVIKYQPNKKIDTLRFSDKVDEQSIYSFRELQIQGITHPCLEIFGQTHQGNGFYYLFEIKESIVQLIALTRAVDFNDGPPGPIKNHRLKVQYIDQNGDNIADIRLTGQATAGERLVKVLIYNQKKKKFIENKKYRKGKDFWGYFDRGGGDIELR
jgi:hypothetical protein